jgi:hypothetical protein
MFDGLAFISGGHMSISIAADALMARVSPANCNSALPQPHVRAMDFTGKPMRGLVFVDADGLRDDSDLNG